MSKELADQLECLMKCATLSFTDRELLQRAAELLRRAHGTDSEPATEGKAHYIDCWRNHGHHKCAIDVAEVALAQLSALETKANANRSSDIRLSCEPAVSTVTLEQASVDAGWALLHKLAAPGGVCSDGSCLRCRIAKVVGEVESTSLSDMTHGETK